MATQCIKIRNIFLCILINKQTGLLELAKSLRLGHNFLCRLIDVSPDAGWGAAGHELISPISADTQRYRAELATGLLDTVRGPAWGWPTGTETDWRGRNASKKLKIIQTISMHLKNFCASKNFYASIEVQATSIFRSTRREEPETKPRRLECSP